MNKQLPLSRIERDLLRQQQIKDMKASGDLDRLALSLAIAYELISLGNSQAETAAAIVAKYPAIHQKVSTKANNFQISFDVYDQAMRKLIGPNESFEDLNHDFTLLEEIIETFMNKSLQVKRGSYLTPTIFLPNKK